MEGSCLGVNALHSCPWILYRDRGYRLGVVVLGVLMLTSSIVAGVVAMSRRSQVRWTGAPELVDLDLSCYDMRSDLLDL